MDATLQTWKIQFSFRDFLFEIFVISFLDCLGQSASSPVAVFTETKSILPGIIQPDFISISTSAGIIFPRFGLCIANKRFSLVNLLVRTAAFCENWNFSIEDLRIIQQKNIVKICICSLRVEFWYLSLSILMASGTQSSWHFRVSFRVGVGARVSWYRKTLSWISRLCEPCGHVIRT